MSQLLNKKVKIEKDFNLSTIIEKLKKLNIHTAYIGSKKELHSLFFMENETLFLLNKPISDNEFNDSELEEISFKDFLNILDLNKVKPQENSKEQNQPIQPTKKYLVIDIPIKNEKIIINMSQISYIHYIDNLIIINLINGDNFKISEMNKEFYDSILSEFYSF